MSEEVKYEKMNIRALLSESGYEICDSPLGMKPYKAIELGRMLQKQSGGHVYVCTVDPTIDQIFVYGFWDGGFTIERWVKEP